MPRQRTCGARQAHFGDACNRWFHQVHLSRFTRTEIDIYRLPSPRFVLHRNFDAHRVGKLHLMDFRLQRLLKKSAVPEEVRPFHR